MAEETRTALPELLRLAAVRNPSREAIRDVRGPTITYGNLDRRARQMAALLRSLGVQSGDHVAVMTPTSIDAYVAWIGTSWLGAVEVPLNTQYRRRSLAHVLNDSAARIAIVSNAYAERLAEVAAELLFLEAVVFVDGPSSCDLPFRTTVASAALIEEYDPVESQPAPASYDLCCVMYTSGTTGPSKGVLMPWACLDATARSWNFTTTLASGGSLYSAMPTFHLGGKTALNVAVLGGARLVIREGFSTDAFWDDVRTFDICCTGLIGATASFISRQPVRLGERLTPLRDVLMGPVIPEYREFEARFGVKVRTLFGMTEIGGPIGTEGNLPNHRTCGRPLPGFEVRVVDDHDRVVCRGEVGELIVRSDEPWVLNVGYFGLPEQTARAWRNGWFHTGDSFTVDDEGWLYFVDRKKDSLRRRGENISSFEVEVEVATHHAVAEVAAVAVPSEHGEDEIKIVVVRTPGADLTHVELTEYLISRMPRFMVPRYVEFVTELPRTPTAKVMKAELRAHGITSTTWDREAAGIEVPR
jgi:carnitine-CoA ligase